MNERRRKLINTEHTAFLAFFFVESVYFANENISLNKIDSFLCWECLHLFLQLQYYVYETRIMIDDLWTTLLIAPIHQRYFHEVTPLCSILVFFFLYEDSHYGCFTSASYLTQQLKGCVNNQPYSSLQRR